MMNTTTRISIIQYNTAKTPEVIHTTLKLTKESSINFVLIQEPWIAFQNNSLLHISHSSYHCILSSISNNIRFRVAIYARKQLRYNYYQRTDMTSSFNIIILDISGLNIETFHLINIYNEKSLDSEYESINYTMKRCLQNI